MELVFAFPSDDEKELKAEGHFGDARFYFIYKISDDKKELLEMIKNPKFIENETLKHGDPAKASSVISTLKDVNVVASKEFGPNIKKIIKQFACVVLKTNSLNEGIELIQNNLQEIISEYQKGENRKAIVLKKE